MSKEKDYLALQQEQLRNGSYEIEDGAAAVATIAPPLPPPPLPPGTPSGGANKGPATAAMPPLAVGVSRSSNSNFQLNLNLGSIPPGGGAWRIMRQ